MPAVDRGPEPKEGTRRSRCPSIAREDGMYEEAEDLDKIITRVMSYPQLEEKHLRGWSNFLPFHVVHE